MEDERKLVKNTPDLVDFVTKAQNIGMFRPESIVALVEFFEIRSEYKELDRIGKAVDQEALLNNLDKGNEWLESHAELTTWFFNNYR